MRQNIGGESWRHGPPDSPGRRRAPPLDAPLNTMSSTCHRRPRSRFSAAGSSSQSEAASPTAWAGLAREDVRRFRRSGLSHAPDSPTWWAVFDELQVLCVSFSDRGYTGESPSVHQVTSDAVDKHTTAADGEAMNGKRKAESHSRTGNRQRVMKARGLQVDSERDSGFSDASSEHLSLVDTTDSEDSPRAAVQQGVKAASSGPSSQLAVVGGSYSSLSPMIIMNNVLLKQPGDNPPALKPWGFRPTVEVVQPVVQQPQVVFLQPLVSRQPSPAPKELSSRHRRPKNYLPILKSYPKIAPHPGDGSGSCSSGRGTASSSSSSSGSEKSASQAGQRDRQQKSGSFGCSAPAAPSSPSSVPHGRPEAPVRENPSSAVGPADLSSLACFSTPENTQALPDPSESSADIKRKRFCNTYNILSKSGLLDIALRTKELHRQNRRTQSELEQLKEQTDLFLQALYSGDPGLCVRLHARLQEAGGEAQTGAQADRS